MPCDLAQCSQSLPLVLLFDSLVSWLRLYSLEELRGLTAGMEDYRWDIGTVRGHRIPVSIPYLIGVPRLSRQT